MQIKGGKTGSEKGVQLKFVTHSTLNYNNKNNNNQMEKNCLITKL